MKKMLTNIQPTTAAVVVAGLLAISAVAILGGEKLQVAIAGGITTLAAALARSLVKHEDQGDDDDDQGLPPSASLMILLMAVGAGLCATSCALLQAEKAEAESQYRGEQLACVDPKKTREQIEDCRRAVRERWGIAETQTRRDGGR